MKNSLQYGYAPLHSAYFEVEIRCSVCVSRQRKFNNIDQNSFPVSAAADVHMDSVSRSWVGQQSKSEKLADVA